MEIYLALLVGCFFALAIYLILSVHTVRIVLGIAIFGNAVHMSIFAAGRLTREVPPIVPSGLAAPAEITANPLPQALILTAIVISFSLFAYVLVLVYRAYQELGTDTSTDMNIAEPQGGPTPDPDTPRGY
ncbi:MAG: Na+/H+ antiporter subunit C [Pseudomonadota bacterium]